MALVRFVAGAQAQSEAPDGPTVLSPWPSEATAKAAAIERLREAVGSRSKSDNAADALGSAASAMVEREAPGAPQAVKDEAVIRLAGYWAQSDFGGIESETSVGGKVVSYFRPPASAFRYSGAKGLGVGLKLSTPGVPRTVYAGTRYAVAGHVGPVGATFITKCRMSASSFV